MYYISITAVSAKEKFHSAVPEKTLARICRKKVFVGN